MVYQRHQHQALLLSVLITLLACRLPAEQIRDRCKCSIGPFKKLRNLVGGIVSVHVDMSQEGQDSAMGGKLGGHTQDASMACMLRACARNDGMHLAKVVTGKIAVPSAKKVRTCIGIHKPHAASQYGSPSSLVRGHLRHGHK